MSEMMCCPLSGNDGDPAELCETDIVRARKEYACTECGETIRPGDKHERVKGMWDKEWSTFRTCLSCVEIREHFSCGSGWLFGCLWDDLRENFFPDMKAGGQCMTGLSPAAKARLIEMRMAWYLSHDEAPHDDKWEGDAWKPTVERPRVKPAFVPPAYAALEYEPCGADWGCNVQRQLGYLRRGGLNEQRTQVVYADLHAVEESIREAERYCRKIRPYAHAESIVPGDPQNNDLHG